MNDLHIGFIALAVLAVVAVIIYNKWQDFRQSKKAQTMLHRKNNDEFDAANNNENNEDISKVEPNLGFADNEEYSGSQANNLRSKLEKQQNQNQNQTQNQNQNQNNNQSQNQHSENISNNSINEHIFVSQNVKFPNENYVDPRFEWSAILEFAEPIEMSEIFNNATDFLPKIGKPMTWLGYDKNSNRWEFLSPKLPERSLQKLIISLQLCNRDGAASEHDIHAFEALVNHLAEVLMSVVKFTEIDPISTAKEIDDFCSDVDIEISINLAAKKQENGEKKYFSGSQIFDLAKEKGLEFDAQEGCFIKSNKQGNLLYKLMNNTFDKDSESEAFNIHNMNSLKTSSISFVLYVPCCPNGGESYNDLLINASHFAKVLDADLVDDNNHKLGAEELQRIMNDYIVKPQLIMYKKDFPPGSNATLRLFS